MIRQLTRLNNGKVAFSKIELTERGIASSMTPTIAFSRLALPDISTALDFNPNCNLRYLLPSWLPK